MFRALLATRGNAVDSVKFIFVSLVLHIFLLLWFWPKQAGADTGKGLETTITLTYAVADEKQPLPARAPRAQKQKEQIKPIVKNDAKSLPTPKETERSSQNISEASSRISQQETQGAPGVKSDITKPVEPQYEKDIAASYTADYLKNPRPAYPPMSRRLGEEGKVLLRVYVAADGSVSQVTVQNGSGYERLDEAAMRAVKNWKFAPAKKGGASISSWVNVPIVFSLNRQI